MGRLPLWKVIAGLVIDGLHYPAVVAHTVKRDWPLRAQDSPCCRRAKQLACMGTLASPPVTGGKVAIAVVDWLLRW
ncbi:hypothetical protein QBC33DRAFT_527756 [Phialemonium atrogriseum]|uniref:Uncharacterized protein n=1 Tax=Phialemonium atrogriseum TaxID=1093897 RepID=A0AAJ0C568_9PEZI|nr:uncharacterized protein QBC33DRAFT_527756 [Phialemonium atrogriseum]KAK1770363.1 hypothetical protein QBC33DRAFT_527756 [Phialemonium atrogriseum]